MRSQEKNKYTLNIYTIHLISYAKIIIRDIKRLVM